MMRQKIMATIIVLGISITAASLTRPQVGPELVVEPERVYVLQGHETEDVVVRLKNTGDSPLKIKAVEKSCSCVSGELSGRVAEPGSFCELTVSSSGVSDGSLFIMSNAPNRPEMRLPVVVVPRAPFDANPAMLDFGVLPARSASKRACSTLLRLNPDHWDPALSSLDARAADAEVEVRIEVLDVHEARLTIFRLFDQKDPYETSITITKNGEPIGKSVPVRAAFDVR